MAVTWTAPQAGARPGPDVTARRHPPGDFWWKDSPDLAGLSERDVTRVLRDRRAAGGRGR